MRALLLDLQRDLGKNGAVVLEGRDIGTVVFPGAEVKIFLTASLEERAQRRYKQLKEKGIDVNISGLTDEIAKRDARDTARTVAPLRPAPGAVVLDSSQLSIDEVVRQVLQLWQDRRQ